MEEREKERGIKDNSPVQRRGCQKQGTLKLDSGRLSQFLSETRFLYGVRSFIKNKKNKVITITTYCAWLVTPAVVKPKSFFSCSLQPCKVGFLSTV